MITFETIIFIVIPVLLVLFVLWKKKSYEPKSSFWRNQKWQCSDVLVVVMCLCLFQLIALLLGKYEIVKYYYIFIYGNLFSKIALGLLAFGLLHRKYNYVFSTIGLSNTKTLSKIAFGLAAFILYTLFISTVFFFVNDENIFHVWAQYFISIKLNQWPQIDSFIYIFSLVILAPFVEEFIFRGIMYGPFLRKIGTFGSICLTSIIWASAHIQIKSLLSLFFIGIILGYLYKSSKSLIPGIITHSLINISNLLTYFYWIA
jgi:membrane protease YdiL (CAAX protease family)